MAEPLIRTEHLSVVYNQGKQNEVRSLWDANVTIYPEEFVIIHGPSGCGKSTLMYSISSLQPPTSGDVFLQGKSLTKFSKKERLEFRRTGMGMIFQAFYLIETLRVIDNVCLPKVFRDEDKEKRREDAMVLLKRFGIDAQSDRYPSQLSGGQKQRVAISRALVNNPNIILADEPVGNLDSESSRVVLEILRELNEKDKKTIILVTHDPSHLVFGDRIIHMKDGRVIKEEVRRDKRKLGREANEDAGTDLTPEQREGLQSSELSVLLRSFQGLPKEYIQTMLAPFKARQLMFHFMSDISEQQWGIGECILRERLDNMIGSERLLESLDKPVAFSGMGLNRTRAVSLAGDFEAALSFVRSLDGKTNPNEIGEEMFGYLKKKFDLQSDESLDILFLDQLIKRSSFAIGKKEMLAFLDNPRRSGGLGLHRVMAEKVAREIELLFLLHY